MSRQPPIRFQTTSRLAVLERVCHPCHDVSFSRRPFPSGATATTVNLSIVTTASTAVLGIGRKMVFYALSLPFLAVLGLNLPRVRISKRAAIFGSAGIVMLVIVLTSCGGGLSEPGPGRDILEPHQDHTM